MLYDERLGLYAFALLILHGIIDSADGQLARMTGQVTELGRVLDGGAGYLTHAAIYLAIAAGVIHRGGSGAILIWMVLAGIANAMQAQMYEYHRHDYATIAVMELVPRGDPTQDHPGVDEIALSLVPGHATNAQRFARRGGICSSRRDRRQGCVREDDRARYRKCFYWPMRGWNLLGDNTRLYAIGYLYVWTGSIYFSRSFCCP